MLSDDEVDVNKSLTPPVQRLDTSTLLHDAFDGLIDLPSPDEALVPPEALLPSESFTNGQEDKSPMERSFNSWLDCSFTDGPSLPIPQSGQQAVVDRYLSVELSRDCGSADVDQKPLVLAIDNPAAVAAPAEQLQLSHGLRVSPFTAHVGVPCISSFHGDLKFSVTVADSCADGKQRRYFFSSELNKLFVDMMTAVPIELSVCVLPKTPRLFVRCMPVYRDIDYRNDPVNRCPAHRDPHHPTNNSLTGDRGWHFVRVARGSDAIYHRSDGMFVRRSVVCPWPSGATLNAMFIYTFTCMSTCIGGVARRSLLLLFLLEDSEGRVYGRQTMELKVCKCPRRDVRHDLARVRRIAGQRAAVRSPLEQQVDSSPTPPAQRSNLPSDDAATENTNKDAVECVCGGATRFVVPVASRREFDTLLAIRDTLRRDRSLP